ncbi:sensor domain-containing diguanylate cyclase [Clostridium carnis]
MDDYMEKYNKLKETFQRYQKLTEEKIQELSAENIQFEKNLDMLSNVILISNYVNSNLSSSNIIPMINDMIIGILGVTQSTIYLFEGSKFVIKATNGSRESIVLTDQCKKYINKHKTFIINSKEPIVKSDDSYKEIHSRMGVPIKVRDRFIGYIIADHTLYNFLTEFHEIFLNSIASQIAIAIENSILYRKIEKAARRDALIGIYNRKTFFEVAEKRIMEKANEKYALVMIDLDNFKETNDTYGHQFGDLALKNTANLIRSMLKSKDIIARYGGEEFILYINNVESFENVYVEIDKIRKAISESIISKEDISKSITASFGLSFYPEDGENLDKVIKVADKLLYNAKHAGRNKVISSHLFR